MRSDYMRHRRTLVQASLIASVLLIGSGCVSTDTHQKALDELEKNDVIIDALGKHITSHFVAAKRQEWREYITQVSAWELESYLAKY